jgi:hypothetical protein
MIERVGTVTELGSITPPLKWIPDISGEQTRAFIERQIREGKTKAQLDVVINEATRILGRCVDPKRSADVVTGLVVGRIQSGKTMSFTTLAALAHDNGYGLVIILGGTKNNLIAQTVSRLQDDLQISEKEVGKWIFSVNPKFEEQSGPRLKQAITKWLDPNNPVERKRVPIVIVLKHAGRMDNLAKVLTKSSVENVPILIIDDESDQAGLNTYASKNRQTNQYRMSSNYAKISLLRGVLPFHAYVQYTATPQANLLVDINDCLSPDFAEPLIPGEEYRGGKHFFFDGSPYIIEIPDSDIPRQSNRLAEVPRSLLDAFSVYVYGCAYAQSRGDLNIRTMMIHPSQETPVHRRYFVWAQQVLDEWRSGLADGETTDRSEYIYELLEDGKKELQRTFEEKLPDPRNLPIYDVLLNIEKREVNATPYGKSKIVWGDSQYWLLVGGAKLDRGFTVRGLTVTYMPRSVGDGNADSIQQRARFFGYNKSYFEYCRVYLEQDVKQAFKNYVEHEEFMLAELIKQRGYPLKSWVRKFLLDSRLNPTRKSVIGIDKDSIFFEGWKHPNYLAENEDFVEFNQRLVYDFLLSLPEESKCDPVVEFPEHFIDRRSGDKVSSNLLYEGVPVQAFINSFLTKFKVSNQKDIVLFDLFKLLLERLLESGEVNSIDIFNMRSFEIAKRSYSDGRINPFQGRSPSNTTDTSALTYGGDQSFHFEDRVTVQIHFLEVHESTDLKSRIVSRECPWLCFYVPKDLSKNFIFES